MGLRALLPVPPVGQAVGDVSVSLQKTGSATPCGLIVLVDISTLSHDVGLQSLQSLHPPAVWFSSEPRAPSACALIFVAAAVTDFLDGYLARTMVHPYLYDARSV